MTKTMKKNLQATLCLEAALASVALCGPALAQSTEDIVVTARRVEERLQDVPISIAVFSQEQLTDRNVLSGADLATYTPSLSANTRYGVENTTFAIRGFSQEQRTTASVGVYFADVVAPRGGASSVPVGDGAGPGAFFDLQNVQVLRGPQGTLFGRNTTGGAVLLVPRRPTDELEGYVEGTLGDYNLQRVQAVFNAPLNEHVRARFGADWNTRDGYLDNFSGIGPEEYANVQYLALRGSVVVDITPNIENYTIISYSESDVNGTLPRMGACAPTLRPSGGPLSCNQLARQQGRDFHDAQGFVSDPRVYQEQWQVINTTTFRLSDSLTLRNIASYSELYNRQRADIFGAAWIIPAQLPNSSGTLFPSGVWEGTSFGFNTIQAAPGLANGDQANWTEELQLQGDNGALTWQAGVYAEGSDPLALNGVFSVNRLYCTNAVAFQCTDVVRAIIGGNPYGTMSVQYYQSQYRDYGAYAQASYDITDQWSVTAGYRYTWDEVQSFAQNVSYRFNTPNTPTGFCANVTLRNPTLAITNPSNCNHYTSVDSEAPTWMLGVDFTPTDDVLLYAKYARGYRQGNTSSLSAGGFTEFEAESVDAYEVGAKTSWEGALPGFFNIALFYNELSNQQLTLSLSAPPPTPPNIAVVNVGASEMQGVEIEAGIEPFQGLRLEASYAYLDTELVSADPVTFPPGSPFTGFGSLPIGANLPLSPENKYTISATYTFPTPESVGDISVGINYAYTDDQIITYASNGTVSTNAILPEYGIANLNMNWRSVMGSNVDLGAFVSNLMDEEYYTQVNDQMPPQTSGFQTFQVGPPRMFGVRLRYNFGG